MEDVHDDAVCERLETPDRTLIERRQEFDERCLLIPTIVFGLTSGAANNADPTEFERWEHRWDGSKRLRAREVWDQAFAGLDEFVGFDPEHVVPRSLDSRLGPLQQVGVNEHPQMRRATERQRAASGFGTRTTYPLASCANHSCTNGIAWKTTEAWSKSPTATTSTFPPCALSFCAPRTASSG